MMATLGGLGLGLVALCAALFLAAIVDWLRGTGEAHGHRERDSDQ